MIKTIKNMTPNGKKTLSVLLAASSLIIALMLGRASKSDSASTVPDTVYIEKPVKLGGTITPDNTIVEEKKPSKPIPSVTTFKVTDWVCAWGNWSGVVREISWSTRAPNVLVYTVQHYNDEDGWYENDYVETELTAGKCN